MPKSELPDAKKAASATELERALSRIDELEQANQRLQRLISTGPAVMHATEPYGDHANLYGSDNTRAHTGYETQAFLDDPNFWESRIHPDDRERVMGEMHIVLENDRLVQEYRFLHGDGLYRWVRHQFSLVRGDDGKPKEILGYWIDITESKQAAEALRENQERFEAVINNSPGDIFLRDLEGRYILVSRSFAQRRGKRVEELVGKTVGDLFSPDVATTYKEHDRSVINSGAVIEHEYDVALPDGSSRRLISTKFPIRRASGEIIAVGGIATDITDRKRAEQELRDSETKFRALAEGSIQGIAIVRNSTLLYANQALARTWGYASPEAMIGADSMELLVAPQDRERIRALHSARMAGAEAATEYEVRGQCKDGSLIWLSALARTVEWDGKRAAQITYHEITKWKEAEAALRESQERFEAVLENFPAGIHLKDLEGKIILVNRYYAERTGEPGEDLIGKTVHDLYSPAIAAEFDQQDRKVVESGEVSEDERELQRGDGKARRISIIKFPVRNQDGEIIAVGCVSSDVTPQRQAEAALRESQERFAAVINHSPAGIFMKDLEGRFILANRSYAERRGLQVEDIIGKTVWDFFPSSSVEGFEAQDRKVAESGELMEQEHDAPLHDGTMRRVNIIKFPVRDADGKIIAIGAVANDVTAQRNAEHRLREAQKMEAVGQLAGGIAHDFNNTLQVIINYAEHAKSKLNDPDKLSAYLDNIFEAGQHAATLTKQLLAFSRKSLLQRRPLDLNSVTAGMLTMAERLIGADIALTFKPGGNLHRVLADRGMIEQVLLNLCVNARDAMPDGGSLSIETGNFSANREFCLRHDLAQPANYVMLAVSDTGVGMESDTLEHMFEPFFTTKEVGKGTGLGLAMVHGIVSQHQGVIEIVSQAGAGTTFRIYLPATAAQDVPEPQIAQAPLTGNGETILVAEDERGVRDLLAGLLEEEGYIVLTAADGEEALAVFSAHPNTVQLAILDVVMPRMRGPETCARIRSQHPGVPIIFSTGYSDDAIGADLRADETIRIIQKPYTPGVLYRTVREMLDLHR